MPLIYITGIPRSGSTWGYNIARLTMYELYGQVPNFNDRQVRRGIPESVEHGIAKTHRFVVTRPGSIVIHSTRNYMDALASWRKLDPLCTASAEFLQSLDYKWRPHANIMYHRTMLADRQTRLCIAWSISRLLGQDKYAIAEKISDTVDSLGLPKKGMDPVTFLQKGHFG